MKIISTLELSRDILDLFFLNAVFFLHLFCRVSGHPLAQNERCLHMFLTDPIIDKNYVPGKVRST